MSTVRLYPLCDYVSSEELRLLGFSPSVLFNERCQQVRQVMAERTGEFRKPKAGEWFLSGAVPESYKTRQDLRTPYHILRLVRVVKKHVTIYDVISRIHSSVDV